MRKLIWVLLLSALLSLTSVLSLFAQAPFSRSDVWQNGDEFTQLGLLAESLDPGASGSGVTWNFSNIVRSNQGDGVIRYLSPSGTPNASSFPDANSAQTFVDVDGEVGYQYYNVSDSGITEEGQDTPAGIIILSDKRVIIPFPFGFNQTHMDTYGGTFTLMVDDTQVTITRSATYEAKYDGFGTLNLGTKTYSNVRRVKTVQSVMDSFNFQGMIFTNTSETTSYAYFSPESRSPILNLSESTTTNFGITVNSKSANFQDLDGTSSPTSNRYGTHLTAQGGNFNSELILRNPTGTAQVFTLNPLRNDGSALTPVTVNLPANGTQRMLQENYFPADAVSFNASGCSQCIFTTGYRADLPDGSTAHVPQTVRLGTEYYFYPGEWDLLFDGAALINAGSGPAKIDASQMADDGTLLSQLTLVEALPAGGKYLDLFNGKFANEPNSIIKLNSTQPLAVMILRISQDFRYLYQNLALPEDPGTGGERWLAHITSGGGGFNTSVLVHNRGSNIGAVTLQPYNASGQALTPVPVVVNPGTVERFSKSEILPDEASHMSILGSADCVVSLGYQSVQENSSTAQIHEAPSIGTTFFIYPGEWDYLFDGLAIINLGDEEASILATQIRDDGATVGNISLNAALQPNAKYLAVLEGMLAPNPNAIIKIESTEPMAILALRLSKDSRFLYGNSPIQP